MLTRIIFLFSALWAFQAYGSTTGKYSCYVFRYEPKPTGDSWILVGEDQFESNLEVQNSEQFVLKNTDTMVFWDGNAGLALVLNDHAGHPIGRADIDTRLRSTFYYVTAYGVFPSSPYDLPKIYAELSCSAN